MTDEVMNQRNIVTVGKLKTAIAVLAFMTMAGCAETTREEATGEGRIRGVNGIVDAPEVQFLIEEIILDNIGFKIASGFETYDDLSYNFNFDLFVPGEPDTRRIASRFIDVVADTDYTLILTGTMANPSIIVWEDEPREFDGSETVFENTFAHLAPSLGQVDVYFAPSGTPPAPGGAVATLSLGERTDFIEYPQAEYELVVTAPSDPGTVIFQSGPLNFPTATRQIVGLFDPDPSITAPLGVAAISPSGLTSNIADVNFPPQLRFVHASNANAAVNVDGYVDMDFNNPVFSNVAYRGVSAYFNVDVGQPVVTATQAGNPGGTIVENPVVITSNSKRTLLLGGDQGSEFFRSLPDDARPLASFPVVRFVNMAVNSALFNIYIQEPGFEITEETVPSFIGLSPQFDTGFFGPPEGTFEITITAIDDIVPLAPVFTIDFANRDVVDIVILDTDDPNVFEIFEFDRF